MRNIFAGGGLSVLLLLPTGSLCKAALHGTVQDSSGAAVPRARVYVLRTPFPALSTLTDSAGSFQLPETGPGQCVVFAASPGLSGDKVSVSCDAPDALSLVIKPSAVSEAVVVTAERAE